jgi:hypothetical protein
MDNLDYDRLKRTTDAHLMESPMEDVWTADQLAMQAMVWQMVRDGAVRGAQLACEFERNARYVPTPKAYPLVILACLARAAAAPEPAEDRRSVGSVGRR